MMKPITKFTTSLIDASRVATTIAHAIHTAEGEKPGAVHIELPEDIAREDAHGYTPFTFEKIRRPIPDDKAIAHLISYIETAKTPVLLIGAGANRKRITNYLTKVIKKYHLPFFTSQMGKGVVDERMPEYI
jgi:acetolactate synthase-1/2/3 large subunit